MLLSQRIIDYAHRYRSNRERRRLEEILSAMPAGIRKDLGWPSLSDLGPMSSCKRGRSSAMAGQ